MSGEHRLHSAAHYAMTPDTKASEMATRSQVTVLLDWMVFMTANVAFGPLIGTSLSGHKVAAEHGLHTYVGSSPFNPFASMHEDDGSLRSYIQLGYVVQ